MQTAVAAAVLMFSATAALSCSAISDDAARLACFDQRYSAVSLIRCTQAGSHASCDLLTPSPDTRASCVVFDAEGEPIARNSASGSIGLPLMNVDAGLIASVDCEITG
ncbi:hypothetical protein [Paracoccus hibiscisoli]|uniref:hypothetical protein n=1 Tax=Paracoccus hibiscisoli TaxID=2023261 RepID=UPI0023EFEF20|nr:hypothetical protein [Paracoccus hibiscisoli]